MRTHAARHAVVLAIAAWAPLAGGCQADERTPGPAPSAMASAIAGLEVGREAEVAPGVFMLMKRVGATSPIGDGWHRAESAEGGFAVELPLPFNDFRIRSTSTDGVAMMSHTLGGKSPGLLSWMAMCAARADGKAGPGAPSAPDVTEEKGWPVRAIQRTVQVGGRSCVVIVEAQGTDPLPPEADRKRFLGSFRLLGATTP